MNSTTVNQRRYIQFRSHFLPRTKAGRAVVVLYLTLLACAEWPVLPLANRIEPTFRGFPFVFVYLSVLYVAMIATLLYAAIRKL